MFAVIGAGNECYFNDNSFSSVAPALTLAIESFGLSAGMNANLTTGPSNLGVQFFSVSTPASGIESWEWDLDGDGTIDSTDEDPYFLYEEQGTYDITLTITQDGETSTLTIEDYITVTDGSNISGLVSGIWKPELGPYNVVESIEINTDDQLILEPGVEVIFEAESQLLVAGHLIADGITRDNEPVILSSVTSWGGIFINTSEQENIIRNCEISNVDGCAIFVSNGSTVDILENIIYDNISVAFGTIDVDGCTDVVISNNIITNNTSSNATGGIKCNAAPIEVTNNVIVNNTGVYGAFVLDAGSDLIITNNTIANNESTGSNPNLFFVFNSNPIITNSIIINDSNIFYAAGTQDVTYSCISNGYEGTGNIDEDPLFASPSAGNGAGFDGLNADWRLQAASLCVDAGDPDAMYNDPDGTRNDMGAYGGPEAAATPFTGINNDPVAFIVQSSINIYPNPFNPQTNIALTLAEIDKTLPVSVKIYNLKGQLVKTLVDNEVVTNSTFIWNGTDNNKKPTSTGMYLLKMKTASSVVNGKLLLMK